MSLTYIACLLSDVYGFNHDDNNFAAGEGGPGLQFEVVESFPTHLGNIEAAWALGSLISELGKLTNDDYAAAASAAHNTHGSSSLIGDGKAFCCFCAA